MSGIGDYIHYKKSNYRDYGTTTNNKVGNYGSAQSIFQKQRTQIFNRFSTKQSKSQNLKTLETFLTNLAYSKKLDNHSEEAFNKFQERVNKVFNEKYPQFIVDFEKGMNVYYNKPQQIENTKYISIEKLNSYLLQIKDMANGNIALSKKANIGAIYDTIKQLENYLNTHQNEKKINFDSDKDIVNLISEINKVLQMQSIPKNQAIGDVFEYWLAFAAAYANSKAEEMSDQLIIDSFVRGRDRSAPIVSFENFSKDYVSTDEIINSGVFSNRWEQIDQEGYTTFKFNKPTQDKLDVIFNWKGDELKVSAKNYSLKNSKDLIHLVSGTSLLQLISINDVDFVNHWLNCVSGEKRGLSNDVLQAAHTTMKLTILVQALTGLGTSNKNSMADTLILNHRSKKQVYVRSIGQILNAIEHIVGGEFKSLQKIVKISGYPSTIPNRWVGENKGIMSQASAKMRISNLIAKLHTYNLSVSMSPLAIVDESKNLTK